jgi:hypothetical protein
MSSQRCNHYQVCIALLFQECFLQPQLPDILVAHLKSHVRACR